jgi:uncharacterized membrane protein YhfC
MSIEGIIIAAFQLAFALIVFVAVAGGLLIFLLAALALADEE